MSKLLSMLKKLSPAKPASKRRTKRLAFENLETRSLFAVVPIGDPGYRTSESYQVGSLANTYTGTISGQNGADVDLIAVRLFKGERVSVEVTDTWNQNNRQGGLWAHARIFAPNGNVLVSGYHQNSQTSFTIGTGKGVSADGIYYIGISARQNDQYNIVTGTGAQVPANHQSRSGSYSLKITVPPQSSIPAAQLSGPHWISQFPTSKSLNDLSASFKLSATNFISALTSAGASVSINATYRPPQRAFLMHWAWRIAKEDFDPRNVPSYSGVNIRWSHLDENGRFSLAKSKAAAQSMVSAYNIVHKPSLQSTHTQRTAIDMNVAWQGVLSIKNASGQTVVISSGPKNGQNPTLWAVGATFGVRKLQNDPPHWSQTGT